MEKSSVHSTSALGYCHFGFNSKYRDKRESLLALNYYLMLTGTHFTNEKERTAVLQVSRNKGQGRAGCVLMPVYSPPSSHTDNKQVILMLR